MLGRSSKEEKMRQLRISNFSCIKSANIEIPRFTIVIGPQGSGKSVLCKLAYFCHSLPMDMVGWLFDGMIKSSVHELIEANFKQWFPVGAWGNKSFSICYEVGDYAVQFKRTYRSNSPSDRIKIAFSKQFDEAIDSAVNLIADAKSKLASKQRSDAEEFDVRISLHASIRERLLKVLEPSVAPGQLFIPAGRSFFTSIGKAITVFDNQNMLDPLVLRFGRLVTQIRDPSQRFLFPLRENGPYGNPFSKIFGAEIYLGRNKEYAKTPDGRQIPFSALSSGQQELLPLCLAFGEQLSVPGTLYIEEPEAHLFPEAQSSLIEILVGMINVGEANDPLRASRGRRRRQGADKKSLVMTTHSPYVLTKINNMLLASKVSQKLSQEKARELVKLIPKKSFLDANQVAAYAIHDDGKVDSIMDEDGAIDTGYIDSISGQLEDEYLSLLEMEQAS